jgi:transcriptional antiterminator NusG
MNPAAKRPNGLCADWLYKEDRGSMLQQMINGWFAVQVISRSEKRVGTLLQQKGYELFIPTYEVVRKLSDRVNTLEMPLFPGYVFCRFAGAASGLVISTPGVMRIVSFGGKPSQIPNHEIDQIQRAIARGMKSRPCSYPHVGQKVRIKSGPLAGICGVLTYIKNRRLLVLSIEAIMNAVAVDVELCEIVPDDVPRQAA